jgi:N-methylhydantoinase B
MAESMANLHDDLDDGDAFLHNDPYLGNTHAADHAVLVPVMLEGEHVFTVCAKAHQADTGNSLPTTYMPFAKDVYEEGALLFPCIRVQRDYEDIDDVIRLCRKRIRGDQIWYGDYLATLGAARIGQRRLVELAEKHGVETLKEFVGTWLNYSERRMAEAISQLPRGRLTGSSRHDPLPGLPDGIQVKVAIDIDPDDGRIEVDLTDNVDCVPSGVNLSEACSLGGALIAVLNCLDPSVPRNGGSFRRIDVRLRDGCVAGRPRFPHSCSLATTNVINRLINATQTAFAQLGDGFGLAEGGASMGAGFGVVSGTDWRRGGRSYINQIVMGGNGGPATPVCDGWITYNAPGGAMSLHFDSVEIIEQKYPILVRTNSFVPDSGGLGRFRGGPASHVVYGPRRDPMDAYFNAEGHVNSPAGVGGGENGLASYVQKVHADGKVEDVPPIGSMALHPGEYVSGVGSGGGGYGDPLARDPAHVKADLEEGWVTLEAAERDYGVVATAGESGDFHVDEQATEGLRRERRVARGDQ